MAATGFMPKVSGSRIEMVATGPRPGSTPTMLPTNTPRKTPHQVVRLERDAEPVPEIGEGGFDHRPFQVSTGIGSFSR